VRLEVLGKSPAWTDSGGACSGYLVREEATALLLDCGNGVFGKLRARIDPFAVDAVVLTHLHADHASGLEGLAYYSHFLLGRPLTLVVHPAVAARLWEGHLAAGMEQVLHDATRRPVGKRLEDYFRLVPLCEDGAVSVGPFELTCRRTVHHVPTTALRIRAADRCLGYSADTAFDEGLVAWLATADLFVHETNYGIHTPYEKLAALPAHLRAKMRLIHYPDDFDLAASVIEPLRQGQLVEV
jgi:ribonuclease BN (tRNA processing enzyme)